MKELREINLKVFSICLDEEECKHKTLEGKSTRFPGVHEDYYLIPDNSIPRKVFDELKEYFSKNVLASIFDYRFKRHSGFVIYTFYIVP